MRVLGIETSSRRGTVALLESNRPVVVLAHEEQNAHAERMLPLVERALAEAGWERAQIELIGVGIGPGSFTGVRVGIALAQGLALGLGVPLVGVTSLAAMAAAVPATEPGLREPLLDARRDEVFVARYTASGDEIAAARAVTRSAIASRPTPSEPVVHIGEIAGALGVSPIYRSTETDLPHAVWVAALATRAKPDRLPVEPLYVREADAVKPKDAPDALVHELAGDRERQDPP